MLRPRFASGIAADCGMLPRMCQGPDRAVPPPSSIAALIAEHYVELRALAAVRARREGRVATPTSLVNETSIRLLHQDKVPEGKERFMALASLLLTRVVLDSARARKAAKRGSGARPEQVSDISDDGIDDRVRDDVGEAVRAMARLGELMPRKAEALSLHLLCEMPISRVAEALGVSVPTAERDIRFAKAWIADQVNRGATQ